MWLDYWPISHALSDDSVPSLLLKDIKDIGSIYKDVKSYSHEKMSSQALVKLGLNITSFSSSQLNQETFDETFVRIPSI